MGVDNPRGAAHCSRPLAERLNASAHPRPQAVRRRRAEPRSPRRRGCWFNSDAIAAYARHRPILPKPRRRRVSMGLLRRIVTAVEHKLDGPPKPPPHVWPGDQVWRSLLTWERNPGSVGDPNRNGAPSMLDDLIDEGARHRLSVQAGGPSARPGCVRADARRPGAEQGRGHPVPRVPEDPGWHRGPAATDGNGAEEIELDWDAYMAIPDQSARAYHLRIRQWVHPQRS
jgi:hypothetical protein